MGKKNLVNRAALLIDSFNPFELEPSEQELQFKEIFDSRKVLEDYRVYHSRQDLIDNPGKKLYVPQLLKNPTTGFVESTKFNVNVFVKKDILKKSFNKSFDLPFYAIMLSPMIMFNLFNMYAGGTLLKPEHVAATTSGSIFLLILMFIISFTGHYLFEFDEDNVNTYNWLEAEKRTKILQQYPILEATIKKMGDSNDLTELEYKLLSDLYDEEYDNILADMRREERKAKKILKQKLREDIKFGTAKLEAEKKQPTTQVEPAPTETIDSNETVNQFYVINDDIKIRSDIQDIINHK